MKNKISSNIFVYFIFRNKRIREVLYPDEAKGQKEKDVQFVNDLAPHIAQCKAAFNSNLNEEGDIDDTNRAMFDKHVDEIINIIVSYDMGWSKRGNGHLYNSLNGYGAIIGFKTGKVLDFATRNRQCRRCDLGQSCEDHNCRKNFSGSAKAMEADVGCELIVHSKVLAGAKLRTAGVIGDEDATTMALVRKESPVDVVKFSDSGHTNKHFKSALYEIQKNCFELKKVGVIAHIHKLYTYALAQNEGDATKLAKTLMEIPEHLHNNHDSCGSWCKDQKEHAVVFQSEVTYQKIKELFKQYANNAAKLCVKVSSNSNESLNNSIAHLAPKNKCLSLGPSQDFQVALAVNIKNDGHRSILGIKQELGLQSGKNTLAYVEQEDLIRGNRAEKAQLPVSKKRRFQLKVKSDNMRKKKEKQEGTKYQSNCGMSLDVDVGVNMGGDETESGPKEPKEDPLNFTTHASLDGSENDFCFVFFDVETSGLNSDAEILQLAAKWEAQTFSTYVTPTIPVNRFATEQTGLQNVGGRLLLYGVQMDTLPLEKALLSFLHFLRGLEKKVMAILFHLNFHFSIFIYIKCFHFFLGNHCGTQCCVRRRSTYLQHKTIMPRF